MSELSAHAENDPALKHWLDQMYVDSAGPSPKYEAAMACWHDICNTDARHVMVGNDAERHLVLLKKDLEKPNGEARIALGYLYQYGLGLEKNAAEALKLYKSPDGRILSQHLIGELYYTGGAGVTQNYDEAYYWFYRASRNDDSMLPFLVKTKSHVSLLRKFVVYMKVEGADYDAPALYMLVFVLGSLLIFIAERIGKKFPVSRWIFILSFSGYAVFSAILAGILFWPLGIFFIWFNATFVNQMIFRTQSLLNRPIFSDTAISEKRLCFSVLMINLPIFVFLTSEFIQTFLIK